MLSGAPSWRDPNVAQFDKSMVAIFTSASPESAMKTFMDITGAHNEQMGKNNMALQSALDDKSKVAWKLWRASRCVVA